MNFTPKNGYLLIKLIKDEENDEGLIMIKKESSKISKGVELSTGEYKEYPVYFLTRNALELQSDDTETYVLVKEENILGYMVK